MTLATLALLYPPRNDYESEQIGAIVTAAAEQATETRRTRTQSPTRPLARPA